MSGTWHSRFGLISPPTPSTSAATESSEGLNNSPFALKAKRAPLIYLSRFALHESTASGNSCTPRGRGDGGATPSGVEAGEDVHLWSHTQVTDWKVSSPRSDPGPELLTQHSIALAASSLYRLMDDFLGSGTSRRSKVIFTEVGQASAGDPTRSDVRGHRLHLPRSRGTGVHPPGSR